MSVPWLGARAPKLRHRISTDCSRQNLPTFHLLARSAGVRIVLDPAPELVSLTADASQIEQVLVNLVKNAIEACENLDSDARRVVIRTRPGASGGIAVEVEDPALC